MSKRAKNRLDMFNAVTVSETDTPGTASAGVADDTPADTDQRPVGRSRRSTLLNRENALGRLATGKQRTVQMLMHPTSRIRPWKGHNRDYSRLSEERCRDLIDGFRRSGSQEFPAIVRKLDNDPKHDYELICGARRHWTATFLGWDLLIEVRSFDDRSAFTLQDQENRDRADVSDYERAKDYASAMPLYFEDNLSAMARYLEYDKSNLQKLIYLQELPEAIVSAYANIDELKVHHGVEYKKLLADTTLKKRVLNRAEALAKDPVEGKVVLAELKKAAAGDPLKRRQQPISFGSVTLVRASAQGKLAVDLQLPKTTDKPALDALRRDFEAMLKQVISERESTETH